MVPLSLCSAGVYSPDGSLGISNRQAIALLFNAGHGTVRVQDGGGVDPQGLTVQLGSSLELPLWYNDDDREGKDRLIRPRHRYII